MSRLAARVTLRLEIPSDVAERFLLGTAYEGTPLGSEPDHDREAIGELLDEIVSERFHDLLDYLADDAEVECDW